MFANRPSRRRADRGFSLIELLVVVAMIALMLALAGTAVHQMDRGAALASAGDLLSADLALAAQDAHARNRPVELRLYPETSPAAAVIVVPGAAGASASYPFRVSSLPQSVVMERATNFSSLFRSGGGVSTGTEPLSAPPAIRGQTYFGFKIGSDGRTSLEVAGEPWTLTLRNREAAPSGDRPADNFITLLVDPLTGAVRAFQP